MINSVNAQSYTAQQIYSNASKIEKATTNASNTINNENNLDRRVNYISFIETATPEELTARLNNIKQFGPPAAMFNFNNIMNSKNSFEIAGRIERTSGQFDQEAKVFHGKQLDLIKQGEAEGKTAKEILTDIMGLHDKQSELFKLSTNWGTKGLAAPENYTTLVKLTPTYADYHA